MPVDAATHDRHRHLASRVSAGDRDALSALIGELRPMVVRYANKYERRYGLDADDLTQTGLMRLAHCLPKYDPAHGTVLTYAITCVTRAMTRIGRKHAATPKPEPDLDVDAFPCRDSLDFDPDPAAESVHDALSHLPAMERILIVRAFGLDGSEPLGVENAARVSGINSARAQQVYQAAFNRLSDRLFGLT